MKAIMNLFIQERETPRVMTRGNTRHQIALKPNESQILGLQSSGSALSWPQSPQFLSSKKREFWNATYDYFPHLTRGRRASPISALPAIPLHCCWCWVSRRAHTEHRIKHCPSAVKTDWPSKVDYHTLTPTSAVFIAPFHHQGCRNPL